MTFREMVYSAGVTCAQISRRFNFHDDWARERLYSRRAFSHQQLRIIADMTGLSVAALSAKHREELNLGGFYARSPQENVRLWSDDEVAQLREYAAEGRTMAETAKALGRTYNAIFSKSCALGLNFVRSAAGEAADMIRRGSDTTRAMTEDEIADLYAGRRYESANVRYGSTGRAPMRPDRVTVTGSTAQMCVEFAR